MYVHMYENVMVLPKPVREKYSSWPGGGRASAGCGMRPRGRVPASLRLNSPKKTDNLRERERNISLTGCTPLLRTLHSALQYVSSY